jgi:ribose transport system substrate-binding protein
VSATETPRKAYLVRSVVHAREALRAFESGGETLRLRDVVRRTGLGKGLAFRLLRTLHYCGFLEKVDATGYRLAAMAGRRKRYRIGYAGQGHDSSFAREVAASLHRSAEQEGVELLVLDNRYQPKVAVRNAEHLIRERVDLVIEFQTDEDVAATIAARYCEVGLPFIAIDIPHPGGTYFGANNYHAGLLAGRALGQWARTRWSGQVDELLLVGLERAGSLVRSRMSGVLTGFREALRSGESCPVTTLDGDGQFKTSLEKVRRHLRQSQARYVLVGAANDPSALGAARAFEEAGRAGTCAIVGQNGEPDARAELRRPRTPLIASVGYFPELYGEALIKLSFDLLAKRQTPPAVFIRHHLMTAENVDHFYPNDALLGFVSAPCEPAPPPLARVSSS